MPGPKSDSSPLKLRVSLANQADIIDVEMHSAFAYQLLIWNSVATPWSTPYL